MNIPPRGWDNKWMKKYKNRLTLTPWITIHPFLSAGGGHVGEGGRGGGMSLVTTMLWQQLYWHFSTCCRIKWFKRHTVSMFHSFIWLKGNKKAKTAGCRAVADGGWLCSYPAAQGCGRPPVGWAQTESSEEKHDWNIDCLTGTNLNGSFAVWLLWPWLNGNTGHNWVMVTL